MKKVISAIIACVFLMAVASSVAVTSFAAVSPTAPVIDETTTDESTTDESTTKKPVTSDTNPSSPDTGSHVGKTASAAAVVALALGGAVVYTSKKKAE